MPLPKLPAKPASILDTSDLPELEPSKNQPPAPKKETRQASNRRKKADDTPALLQPTPETAPKPAPESKTKVPAASKNQPADKPKTRSTRGRRKAGTKPSTAKLFVLDTNVLLHDPQSIFKFQEHDLYIPMMVLEELDNNKKGLSEVARNARQVSRNLDLLVQHIDEIKDGVALDILGHKDATGRLYFQTEHLSDEKVTLQLPLSKADNLILDIVQTLSIKFQHRPVALVSKDINMRLKAKALGLQAEDYLNDHTIEDGDLLYSGVTQLPENFWNLVDMDLESWMEGGKTFYKIRGNICSSFIVNEFVYLDGPSPIQAQVKELTADSATFVTVRDYGFKKNNVWGINARNLEQNFALNLLMNPECDFVTILGQAGTGKTLLALAAGLTQVLETKRYSEIIMTRATVSVGEDIGYLPGTEEEKMQPWMGALEDNLEFLHMGNQKGSSEEWDKTVGKELISSIIKVKSMNFMRGRTFLNKFLIIDEAQNLTAKQMKTLITRAGPGTKIVCLGNIAQIDTPYLTESSSGLTYVVDRFKGWSHSGHITLQKGERSRLADFASETL